MARNIECSPTVTKPQWVLYRLDDNNNEFLMRKFRNLDEAELALHEFEAKKHKQLYYLRECPAEPNPPI